MDGSSGGAASRTSGRGPERAGLLLAAEGGQSSRGNTGLKVVNGTVSVTRWGGGIDYAETYLHGERREKIGQDAWSWLMAVQAIAKEQEANDRDAPWPKVETVGATLQMAPYGIGSKQHRIGVRIDFPVLLKGQGFNLALASPDSKGTVLAKFEMEGSQCLFHGDPISQLTTAKRFLSELGREVAWDELLRIDDCLDTDDDLAGLLYDLEQAGHRVGTEKYGDPDRSPSPRGVLEGLTCYYGRMRGRKKRKSVLVRCYRKWPALFANVSKPAERDANADAVARRMGLPEEVPLPATASRLEIEYGGTWIKGKYGSSAGNLEGAIRRMHEITGNFLREQVWFTDRPVTLSARESGNLSKYRVHPAWGRVVDVMSRLDRDTKGHRLPADKIKRTRGLPGGLQKAIDDLHQACERVVTLTPREKDYHSTLDMMLQAVAWVQRWEPDPVRIEKRLQAYGDAEERRAAGLPAVMVERDEFGVYPEGVRVKCFRFPADVMADAKDAVSKAQQRLSLEGSSEVPF